MTAEPALLVAKDSMRVREMLDALGVMEEYGVQGVLDQGFSEDAQVLWIQGDTLFLWPEPMLRAWAVELI